LCGGVRENCGGLVSEGLGGPGLIVWESEAQIMNGTISVLRDVRLNMELE
jgi:hypothetical protein